MKRWYRWKLLALCGTLAVIIVVIVGLYMAHGTPDWYGTGPTTTVHRVTDLGELAVRLGSPVIFDRRGNVVWMDSFEHGLNKWVLGDLFANAEVALSSIKAFVGTYACRIVTSDQVNGYTWIAREFQPIEVGQVGCELSYQIVDEEVDYWLSISHYTGTDEYAYRVWHDTSASKLYYSDETLGWTEVAAGVHATTSDTGWNTMKLVVDLESEEYVRVLFNDTGEVLDGKTCVHTTTGTDPGLGVAINAYGDTVSTYVTYVDKVIITQNEP